MFKHCIADMVTFTAFGENFIPRKFLQYKDSWAWRKFYPTKIFGYMVFVGCCLATKDFICSYQRCVGGQQMMKGSHGPRKI